MRFQPLKNGKVEVRWEQAGVPYHRECTTPDVSRTTFPAWPARDVANDPSLLAALTEAMQIPSGDTGRLAPNCIQLRGKQGDIIATAGIGGQKGLPLFRTVNRRRELTETRMMHCE